MAAKLICLLAFIALVVPFGKSVLDMMGLPGGVLSIFREVLLFVLTCIALKRTDIFKARAFFIPVLLYVLLLVFNIGVAAVNDQHAAGLFYARIYLMHVVSAIAIRGLVAQATEQEIFGVVRVALWSGVVILVAAFVIYSAVEFNPKLLFSLVGGQEGKALDTAWYIAGGTWMRMGLPATSPNGLGLIFAFYLLLIIPLLMDGRYLKMSVFAKTLLLCGAFLVMLMSFSRSSWIGLALGLLVTFFLCRREWGIGTARGLFKIGALLIGFFTMVVITLVAVDEYSGGRIGMWFNLNKQGADPSMIGHADTFVEAIDFLEQYFWWGYPKGTVGARALAFGGVANNSENSFIAVFYEMGVPLGVLYWTLVGFISRGLWFHKTQWGMLVACIFLFMVLPHIFAPDVIWLYLVLSVLLGRAMQLSDQARAAGTTSELVSGVISTAHARVPKTALRPTDFYSQ
jgi:hypothetical protein